MAGDNQLGLLHSEKKFVYVLKNIEVDGAQIRANEIGIVENTGQLTSIHIIREDKVIQLSRNEFEYFDVEEVGDQFPKKVCNVCHRLLPTSFFQKNQNGKGNRTVRRPSCNDCREVIDGVGINQREKKEWERREPSLTIFKCPICGKITVPGLTSKVVLDHDHKTGHVRAWICDSCNTGIGRFKDDIDLLKKAIRYLEEN